MRSLRSLACPAVLTMSFFCHADKLALAQVEGFAAPNLAPVRERLVYQVRHSTAVELLGTVLPAFAQPDGTQSIMGTANATSNSILLSGPRETLGEAHKILQLLDQAPKMIAVDIWIVDTKTAGWEGGAEKEIAAAMKESRDELVERLKRLEGQKRASVINHLQLSTVERQESTLQAGERKPRIVASRAANPDPNAALAAAIAQQERERGQRGGGFGGRASSVVTENLGTLAQVTSRVSGDNRIALQLNLEKSFHAPEDAGAAAVEDAEGRVTARGQILMSLVCKTTVNMASGDVVVLSGLTSQPAEANSDIRVFVSATILPQAAREKNTTSIP